MRPGTICLLPALLVLGGAILPDTAGAQTNHSYVLLTANSDTAIFLDSTTLAQNGDQVTAWSVWVYYPSKTIPAIGSAAYIVFQDTYDCKARKSKTNYSADYQADGTLLYSTPNKQEFRPVVPDTLGDVTMTNACGAWTTLNANPFPDISSAVGTARTVMAGGDKKN